MADTNPLLAQLADISEPPLQLSFELAPIWWLTLTLVLIAVLYLFWRLYRRWRFFAAKREALKKLHKLEAQLKQKMSLASDQTAAAINALLKRVLQHYQPAHPVLSQSTASWQQWLSTQVAAPLPDLNQLMYAQQSDTKELWQFYQFAALWLKRYSGKAPNALPATKPTTEVKHA